MPLYHRTDNGYKPCNAEERPCPKEVHGEFTDDSAAAAEFHKEMNAEHNVHSPLSKAEMRINNNHALLNSEKGKQLTAKFLEDPTFGEDWSMFLDRSDETIKTATNDEKYALYVYTDDGPDFRYLNRALRENREDLLDCETQKSVERRNSPLGRSTNDQRVYTYRDLQENMESLFTAERKLSEPQVVYRGITMKDSFMGKMDHEYYDRMLNVGEEINLKGFSSTSPSFGTAAVFTTKDEEVVFEMVTDKGVTWSRMELEHILPRDTQWVVAGSRTANLYNHEYLTVQLVDKDLLTAP